MNKEKINKVIEIISKNTNINEKFISYNLKFAPCILIEMVPPHGVEPRTY